MSDPKTDYLNPAYGASIELLSAMSVLNMYPDPIPNKEGYLSETDHMCQHSMEHMQASFQCMQKCEELYNLLSTLHLYATDKYHIMDLSHDDIVDMLQDFIALCKSYIKKNEECILD